MRRYKNARRGVVLLIVLGMLAMFAMIGITFVLLAGHARRSAVAQAKVGQADNPPDRMADDVIAQVLRGSTDRASVIGPHSLLEDLYGNFYAEGAIDTSVIPITDVVNGGQLLSFVPQQIAPDPGLQPIQLPYQQYVGCVLTMTSGEAAGRSTRIVGYDAVQGFQILRSDTTVNLAANDTFIINGTPFSGTGFGYDPTAGGAGSETDPLLTATEPVPPTGTGQPYALLPNPRAFTPIGTYLDPAGPGGANEDYDAADYQNMLLASVVPQAGGGVVIPIPSLHRPALVNYWFHQLVSTITWPATPVGMTDEEFRLIVFLQPYGEDGIQGNADDPEALWGVLAADINSIVDLKRRIIMRPLREDHPNFTGSNTNEGASLYGIDGLPVDGIPDGYNWDVDNDGDGVMDSIWVDVGLPVRTMRDGRQYKPLAAILCVDMDGRLNLNAHGCLAQVEIVPHTVTLPGDIAPDTTNPDNLTSVPHGQGMGPAEIDLGGLFNAPSCFNLLRGVDINTVGRYGTFAIVGTPPPSAGVPGLDPLSANQWFAYPDAYDRSTTVGTQSYGTPLDMHGSVTVGLDLRGQPLYQPTDSFALYAGIRADNPYELNLSNVGRGVTRTNAADMPFTVNELEAVLRPYDMDASLLPGRLATLAPNIKVHHRHEVTTESWSLPCPGITMPPELRANANVATWFPLLKTNHLADLLRARLAMANSALDPNTPADVIAMQAMVDNLLAPELLSGLKLNLNRPLGNGIDDNGNGVIDEAEEAAAEQFYQVLADGVTQVVNQFYPVGQTDVNGIGGIDPADQMLARQLHARHLYVMMLLLINHDGTDQDVAREVAQWAVNIVDFYDRDSIMTLFEYDVRPFTDEDITVAGTWDADNDPTTDNDNDPTNPPCIVWGCERPELLITETLAFHDRRTEDLSVDNGQVGSTAPNEDEDFDQRVRPQGSLFVELYNPWTDSESLPGELYRTVGGHTGIDLRAMAADGASPVWRMIIVESTNTDDPDDPALTTSVPIERSIYFVDPSGCAVASDGERYYPEPGNEPAISVLKPGRYAVVGPGTGAAGTDKTFVGFSTIALVPTPVEDYNDNTTRRIELTPSTNPDVTQVAVFGDGTVDDLGSLSIQAPIAVVINPPEFAPDQPKRLSVSEPTGGYPACPGSVYAPIRPDPLDMGQTAKMANGTTPQYRWLYLQRLANPLRPYDAATNPYRVVDKAQIDLTAFNGMADDSIDQLVIAATAGAGVTAPPAFFTRERGEDEEIAAGPAGQPHNIWAVELASAAPKADDPSTNRQPPAQAHHFGADFAHTLGYLNEGFGVPQSVPTNTTYDGSPLEPFPWLTWLNRPFLSEMEMMLVPKQQSSQLLAKFSITGGNTYATAIEPYGHVINFFYDNDTPFPITATPHWKLHRLLEFVRVPSPFVGTELQGEPTTFSAGTHDFYPPFNRISNRRDPGRVNLNTITSGNVLSGLVGDFVDAASLPTFWNNFIESRKGDNAGMFALDNDLPTRFANPFRSFAGRYNVPDIAALQTIVDSEVKATLLRPKPGSTTDPLFNYAPTPVNPVNDTDRNPYFRYQLLNRMGSTTTTRSNVYAVWVTVGYFEVEPVPAAMADVAIWPDGFRLGQELGSDTGDITRHRAFYMIDRSIPVGFKRGEDLNTENAILLRRFIE